LVSRKRLRTCPTARPPPSTTKSAMAFMFDNKGFITARPMLAAHQLCSRRLSRRSDNMRSCSQSSASRTLITTSLVLDGPMSALLRRCCLSWLTSTSQSVSSAAARTLASGRYLVSGRHIATLASAGSAATPMRPRSRLLASSDRTSSRSLPAILRRTLSVSDSTPELTPCQYKSKIINLYRLYHRLTPTPTSLKTSSSTLLPAPPTEKPTQETLGRRSTEPAPRTTMPQLIWMKWATRDNGAWRYLIA
jgi:hypothetical protein